MLTRRSLPDIEIYIRNPVKFGVNLEHITILAKVRIVSMYLQPGHPKYGPESVYFRDIEIKMDGSECSIRWDLK